MSSELIIHLVIDIVITFIIIYYIKKHIRETEVFYDEICPFYTYLLISILLNLISSLKDIPII